jgi:PTS system nitrogen regulatory IIA component
MLKVSDKTIYRMIRGGTIPCFRVGGQWRFDRREIVSWMEDARQFAVGTSGGLPGGEDEDGIAIAEFLGRGGIHRDIHGTDKGSAILACLERMGGRIAGLTPEAAFSSIMEREALCPTSVGGGIALPHPRNFRGANDRSLIALCRLVSPVPFGSLDNEDVGTLFFIFPRNEARFLRIQAKLLRLLRDEEVLAAVRSLPADEALLDLFARREAELFTGEAA